MRLFAALFLLVAVSAAHAQTTPVGVWKTIDDKTGEEKSLVRISEAAGVLTGKVEKAFHPTGGPLCDKCPDERHGKPIIGLQIIAGLQQHGEVWDGGTILDPENGKIYTVRLKLADGGRSLEVRGYIGPFFRTQTWVRVE